MCKSMKAICTVTPVIFFHEIHSIEWKIPTTLYVLFLNYAVMYTTNIYRGNWDTDEKDVQVTSICHTHYNVEV